MNTILQLVDLVSSIVILGSVLYLRRTLRARSEN